LSPTEELAQKAEAELKAILKQLEAEFESLYKIQ